MSRSQELTESNRGLAAPLLCLGLLAACEKQQPLPAPAAPESQPATEPHPLQGVWEGDGDSGAVTLTIEGDSLHFYARPEFQYDASIKLIPDTDPPELHATILDTPRTTDSEGELVIAIYEFEDGVLNLAAVDKQGASASFDDAYSRYRLERVAPLD